MRIEMKKLIAAVCMLVLLCAPSLSWGEAANAGVAYAESEIDLDLSAMSGTVAYAQVCRLLSDYRAYEGKIIRMKGWFNVLQDPETGMVYYACIVQDATACCAEGIEFVWAGEHSFPGDYPEPGTGVTVTGRFESYMEGGDLYVHLNDAEAVWEAMGEDQP